MVVASFPVGNYLRNSPNLYCVHMRECLTHPDGMLSFWANSFWLQNLSLISVCPRFSTKNNWPNLNYETRGWSGLTVMATPHKTKWRALSVLKSILKYCCVITVAVNVCPDNTWNCILRLKVKCTTGKKERMISAKLYHRKFNTLNTQLIFPLHCFVAHRKSYISHEPSSNSVQK